MRILGIDPTLAGTAGLALVEVREAMQPPALIWADTWHDPEHKPETWPETVRRFAAYLEARIWRVDLIAYEMPYVHMNVKTAIILAHMGGAILAQDALQGKPLIIPVAPKQAKHALAGNGNATKRDMVSMASKILEGWHFHTANYGQAELEAIADAAGVALAGWFIKEPGAYR